MILRLFGLVIQITRPMSLNYAQACLVCDKDISDHPIRALYCSEKCRWLRRKIRQYGFITCKRCGKTVNATKPKQTFCSRSCAAYSRFNKK